MRLTVQRLSPTGNAPLPDAAYLSSLSHLSHSAVQHIGPTYAASQPCPTSLKKPTACPRPTNPHHLPCATPLSLHSCPLRCTAPAARSPCQTNPQNRALTGLALGTEQQESSAAAPRGAQHCALRTAWVMLAPEYRAVLTLRWDKHTALHAQQALAAPAHARWPAAARRAGQSTARSAGPGSACPRTLAVSHSAVLSTARRRGTGSACPRASQAPWARA